MENLYIGIIASITFLSGLIVLVALIAFIAFIALKSEDISLVVRIQVPYGTICKRKKQRGGKMRKKRSNRKCTMKNIVCRYGGWR